MCRSPSLIGHIQRYRITIRPEVWHHPSAEGSSGSKVKLHSAYMAGARHDSPLGTLLQSWTDARSLETWREKEVVPSCGSRDGGRELGELWERKRQPRTARTASPTRTRTRTRPPRRHPSRPHLVVSFTNQVKQRLCWAGVRTHAVKTAAVSQDTLFPVS